MTESFDTAQPDKEAQSQPESLHRQTSMFLESLFGADERIANLTQDKADGIIKATLGDYLESFSTLHTPKGNKALKRLHLAQRFSMGDSLEVIAKESGLTPASVATDVNLLVGDIRKRLELPTPEEGSGDIIPPPPPVEQADGRAIFERAVAQPTSTEQSRVRPNLRLVTNDTPLALSPDVQFTKVPQPKPSAHVEKAPPVSPKEETTEHSEPVPENKLLTAEEEIALAKQIEAGVFSAEALEILEAHDTMPASLPYVSPSTLALYTDKAELEHDLQETSKIGKAAKLTFLEKNTGLVKRMAGFYAPYLRYMALEDLLQEGKLGLIRAIEKFDYTQGIKFSTYAYPWIRQYIQRSMVKQNNMIGKPDEVHHELIALDKALRDMYSQEVDTPTDSELADRMNSTPQRVRKLRRLNEEKRVVELDRPINLPSGESSAYGEIADRNAKLPDEIGEEIARKEIIFKLIKLLPDEQQQIITLHFGFTGEPLTQQQIAKKLGTTRRKVGIQEKEALVTLHEMAEEWGLDELWAT